MHHLLINNNMLFILLLCFIDIILLISFIQMNILNIQSFLHILSIKVPIVDYSKLSKTIELLFTYSFSLKAPTIIIVI